MTRRVVLALAALCAPSMAHSQVKPDGGTATTATLAASGRMTVGIAVPNASGISHNTYKHFSVPKVGVGLDNRTASAATIVNEVTSNVRTLLNGPVEVLGSRAHVVIANPNGITVDGGRFVNTGGVVLSGGKVRYEPNGGRIDTVVTAGSGDIAIGPGGLAGSMSTLQLVAGRLKVDGAVANTHVSPNADISLVGGRAEVVLDSSVSPLTTLRPLASRRDLSGSAGEIVVDVTPRGSLSASRIAVAVTGRGAGVRYAGGGQASIGEFTIGADGKVAVVGGHVRAERHVKVAASSIAVLNDRDRQGSMTSVSSAVTLLAGTGDIALAGQVSGASRAGEDPDSLGGVTLKAARDIRLRSDSADRLAIAFAAKDDLFVQAGRNLRNDTGRLLSNANLVLRVAGAAFNVTDLTGTASTAAVVQRRRGGWLGRIFGWRRWTRTVDSTFATARIPGQQAFIAGATVDIQAKHIENSGEIDALEGALLISADALVNAGFPVGRFGIETHCGLTCWSRASGEAGFVGGKINAAGSASIEARHSIRNAGDIVAYGNLFVAAPRIQGTASLVPDAVSRPAGLYNGFSGPTALVAMSPVGGTFLAPSGTVTVASSNPVELTGGLIEGQVATIVPRGTDQTAPARKSFLGGVRHIGWLGSLLE